MHTIATDMSEPECIRRAFARVTCAIVRTYTFERAA